MAVELESQAKTVFVMPLGKNPFTVSLSDGWFTIHFPAFDGYPSGRIEEFSCLHG